MFAELMDDLKQLYKGALIVMTVVSGLTVIGILRADKMTPTAYVIFGITAGVYALGVIVKVGGDWYFKWKQKRVEKFWEKQEELERQND